MFIILLGVVGILYEWSEWTRCNTSCGLGKRSRHKICNLRGSCGGKTVLRQTEGRTDELVYEYMHCDVPCKPGEVKAIDIDTWILSNPDFAIELEGVRQRCLIFVIGCLILHVGWMHFFYFTVCF